MYIMPTPYSPRPGNGTRASLQTVARKSCGICSRMPAPSPVLFSQPHAPRWFRFTRICSAWRTIQFDFLPLMLTRKPTPQESCSNCGSYKPCLPGNPGGAGLLNCCPSLLIALCPSNEYKFSYLLLKAQKSAIPQFNGGDRPRAGTRFPEAYGVRHR